MAASLFAWLFNFVELTCLPAALKALILHSFFLFSYVNALKGWCFSLEQDTGIEPASSAWEADVLPMY